MLTFKDIIEKYRGENEMVEKLLTFCHTTDMKTLSAHLVPTLKLTAKSECDYQNNEKVIFLFYGKASYCPPSQQKDKYNRRNPPVTLIYDESIMDLKINRMYCFDSGGYLSGKYDIKGEKPSLDLLSKFSIDAPLKEDIIAAVQAFYESNQNYIKGSYKPFYKEKDNPLCFCLTTMSDIDNLRKTQETEFGPQANTFELQIEDTIENKPIAASIPLSEYTTDGAKEHWGKYFSGTELLIYDYDSDDDDTINIAYSNMRKSVKEFNNSIC